MNNNSHKIHKASTLQHIAHILHRRKMLVFGITLLGFSISAFTAQKLKPVYTASAQLVFEGKSAAFIKTQQAFIGSPRIIQSLIHDIEPNTLSSKPTKKSMASIIARFDKNFSAQPVPDSYLLNLEYNHHSPYLAARNLNKVMDHYLDGLETEQPQNAPNTEILARLQNNVENALDNLENFKQYADQDKRENTTPSKEYIEVQREYKKAKAKIAYFMDQSGAITLNHKSPDILNSKTVQKLNLERIQIEQELKSLSYRYGPKHPKIIDLSTQFSRIHTRINHEKSTILHDIQSQYDHALIQLETLENSKTIPSLGYTYDVQIEFDALATQAKNALKLYTEYEDLYKTQPMRTIASVLRRANIPQTPSFPNKGKLLITGTLLSFIFAILLTLLLEKTRNNFLSGKQLEEYLGFPCYALIPKAKKDKNQHLADYVIDNPASTISEAVRALRLVLKLRDNADKKIPTQDSKVITITSSFPNEGKTTLASWIARLAAKSGERVILIDADLRRPSIHKNFGKQNTLSLVEYLGGHNKLEEVINTNDPSGLHIIYGRSVPNSALDLISSDKMEQLLRSLRKAYDLIIIDSPACMAASDARALEKLSDQLLYVVLWNKTPREVVHNGISQFTQFGNARIATVLTSIDLKKHVQFGYGNAVNYYSNYKECPAPLK
ncbi:MAG: hypothetical protein COA45_09005 [Zetaproteobacteria bacterium]|nr:MAG: hypothetical protein COA45_09005 [Zetaproteobacteria bacterium]